jgi:hypothetical protein
MTITEIPFVLNHKNGTIEVHYVPNRSVEESGFDLLAGFGFDVNMAVGYPTMRAFVKHYQGSGYYTASAWIQIVTRREYSEIDSEKPARIISSVDVNDMLDDLGVPFFAMGFPAEIFDAPCCNLGEAAKLEWIADTFFVTMPSRINNNTITRIAGYQWGYTEYDRNGKRYVDIHPLVVTENTHWDQHLPLLASQFGRWNFAK